MMEETIEGELGPLSHKEANRLSGAALAHLGDAVWELFARRKVILTEKGGVKRLHLEAVRLVSAQAQAGAFERVKGLLSEDELSVYKRARNSETHSAPKSCSEAEYHSSTGLEALIGWLYITNNMKRAEELFSEANKGG